MEADVGRVILAVLIACAAMYVLFFRHDPWIERLHACYDGLDAIRNKTIPVPPGM